MGGPESEIEDRYRDRPNVRRLRRRRDEFDDIFADDDAPTEAAGGRGRGRSTTVLKPVGEAGSPGFPKLAPVDKYLARHRRPVLIGTLLIIIGASPLLFHLRFDFNPLNLKDPKTESMATLISKNIWK